MILEKSYHGAPYKSTSSMVDSTMRTPGHGPFLRGAVRDWGSSDGMRLYGAPADITVRKRVEDSGRFPDIDHSWFTSMGYSPGPSRNGNAGIPRCGDTFRQRKRRFVSGLHLKGPHPTQSIPGISQRLTYHREKSSETCRWHSDYTFDGVQHTS
jgi:hypothetical protein